MARYNEAKELLKKVLPFLDTGHDCLVCGNTHDIPHEPDCFVPNIERLLGVTFLPSVEIDLSAKGKPAFRR